MNLKELFEKSWQAYRDALTCGEIPNEVKVSLQIEKPCGGGIWSSSEIEIHYDNNTKASGCVLVAQNGEDL